MINEVFYIPFFHTKSLKCRVYFTLPAHLKLDWPHFIAATLIGQHSSRTSLESSVGSSVWLKSRENESPTRIRSRRREAFCPGEPLVALTAYGRLQGFFCFEFSPFFFFSLSTLKKKVNIVMDWTVFPCQIHMWKTSSLNDCKKWSWPQFLQARCVGAAILLRPAL